MAPDFFSPSKTPSATQSVDPTVTLDPEFLARSKEGSAKTLSEGTWREQRFSTPHLDGTLVNCFVGESLGLASASQVGQETPIRAPEGHQVAAFTLRGGVPRFIETVEHEASVQLRIGDRRIPVPNLFNAFNEETRTYLTQWEMFCFCLPTDDEVVLEIADEGKTIVVDLRAGVPQVDDDWKATTGFRERWSIECDPENAVFTRAFTTLPPPGLEAETGELSIGLQPDLVGGLLPWTPTQDWAPEGKQWLAVPMNARTAWKSGVVPQFTLRVPQSFMYRDQGGEQVAAIHPESITTDQIVTGQAELLVVWPVSAQAGDSTIIFNAVGEMEVDYAEVRDVAAQFTSPAQPLEFTLTFTPTQG